MLPASVHCKDVNLSILGSNSNLNHSIIEGSGTFVYEPYMLTVGTSARSRGVIKTKLQAGRR
jgi:hypothetical protein